MAIGSLSVAYDMSSNYEWGWSVTQASSSQLTIEGGNDKEVFTGTLAYSSSGDVSGVVNTATYYVDDKQVYSFSGFSADAAIIQAFCVTSGNAQETNGYVLQGNDVLTGSAYSDTLLGYAGNDKIEGRSGNDKIDGGKGVDTAVYSGNLADYTVTAVSAGGGYTVEGNIGSDGIDTLANIERLQFSDKLIALDVAKGGNNGKALEFIGAVAYSLIADKGAIGVVQAVFDAGYSMSQACQLAIDAGLIKSLAGSDSNVHLAELVWRNVIGTSADAAITDGLVAYMDGRVADMSQADFLATIAGLEVNDTHINLTGLANIGVEYAM